MSFLNFLKKVKEKESEIKEVDDNENSNEEKDNILKDSYFEINRILNLNIVKLKEHFYYPNNKDFLIRPVYVKAINAEGILAFMDGIVDNVALQKNIIYPLMQREFEFDNFDGISRIIKKVVQVKDVERINTFQEVISSVLSGRTVLFIDGYKEAISLNTMGLNSRPIEKPENEHVLKGPKEAFTENAQVNRSLIRKQLKDENLVTEQVTVGEKMTNQVSL